MVNCVECAAGSFCAAGATRETACRNGELCPAGSSGAEPCPAGYYCPSFDTSTHVSPCAVFGHAGSSNYDIAKAACQREYGSCSEGSCGSFSYFFRTGGKSCDCATAVGQYNFVYKNSGYSTVGEDYSGGGASVSGNSLFVRRKASSGCGTSVKRIRRGG